MAAKLCKKYVGGSETMKELTSSRIYSLIMKKAGI